MKHYVKTLGRRAARPLGEALARAGVSPDAVTLLGLACAWISAYGFYAGASLVAFAGLLLSGLADLVDGAVARARGRSGSLFGAALDSTLDRYGEGMVFGGILLGLAQREAALWLLLLALLSAIGSFLVSYVRARSEGVGIPCEVGLLERPERLVLLLILALWGERGAPWILGTLALLTHITFLQRLAHVRRMAGAAQSGRSTETQTGARSRLGPGIDSRSSP